MATNYVRLGTIQSQYSFIAPDPSWPTRNGTSLANLANGISYWQSVTQPANAEHPPYISGDPNHSEYITWDFGEDVTLEAIVIDVFFKTYRGGSYPTFAVYSCSAAQLIGAYQGVSDTGNPMVLGGYPFVSPTNHLFVRQFQVPTTNRYWAVRCQFKATGIMDAFADYVEIRGLFLGSWADAQTYVVPTPPPPDVEPDTLDELKDDDGPPPAALVDVTPTQRLPDPWVPKGGTNDTWTNNTAADNPPPTTGEGSSYSYPLVTSVTVDGTAMTEVAVGATDATNNSWAYAPTTGVVDLNYSNGADPNPHMVVLGLQLFFCSGGPYGGPLAFNGNDYLSYLAVDGLPKITLALQDPLFGGASSQVGDIGFINADGKFDALAARFRWESQRATIRFGGAELPYSEYYAMPPAVIYGTKWTENRFTLNCRSAVDELMTSVPASGAIVAADITRSYSFTHELVASTYGDSASNVARHTRALSTVTPYTRAPTDVDSNALANAPIGAIKPLTYGTCYGVAGVVLAQSDIERMVLLSANGIHQILDVVSRDGYRASQAYHAHGSAPATWFSDGVYRSEVRIDFTYGVVHEVFDDLLSDTQIEPLATTPWFLNSGGVPFSYDLEGEEAADGTMLSNPADVINALVVRAGVSTTMNATKQIEAKVDADLYATSLVVTTAAKLQDVITPLLKAISAAIYVDTAGTVSLMLLTPSMAPDHTLVEETGDYWDLEVTSGSSQVLTSVILTYPAPVQGGTATVQTTTIPEASQIRATEALESFDAPLDGLGSNYLAAVHVLHRRMKPTSLAYLTSGSQIVNVQPGDVVKLEKTRLPADALGYIIGQVQSVELDGNTMVNRLVIDDSKTVLETPFQAFLEADDVSLTWASLTAAQRLVRGFWTDDSGYVLTADLSTLRRSMYY